MTDVVEEIETLIDDWHYGAGNSWKYALPDWLGMTSDQFDDYVDEGIIPKDWTPPEWTR
jgi:hypothetical protein